MNLQQITLFLSNRNNLLIFFLVLGLLAFINGLNHPMMIDDHVFFDAASRDPKNLWINVVPDKAKMLNLEGSSTEVYYRPLALLIPKVFCIITGGNVFLMHVINLLIFIAASFLISRFLFKLSGNVVFAVLVSVFVLVHPLNGIIVNFKTAGIFAVQLLILFSCAWILCFKKITFKEHAAASVLLLLALFCHENAFVFPLALALLSFVVQRKPVHQIWFEQKTLWITAIIYFLLRLKWASLSVNIFGKFSGYHMSVWEYLASWFALQGWYISRFFIPDGIVISVFKPVVRDSVDVWCIMGVSAWTGAIWIAWKYLRDRAWMLLGLSWTVLGMMLLGAGALFHGQYMFIEVHWFTFTSIGFFMILADGIVVLSKGIFSKITLGIAAVLLSGFILITWQYNALWNNELTYSQYWLKQSPFFKPIHMYMARYYFAHGKLDLASEQYQMALTGQYPDYIMYSNLGSIALFQGNLEKAKEYLTKAVAIEPKARNALNTLAVVCLKLNDIRKAEEYFRRSVQADPFDTTAQYNLQYFLRTKNMKGSLSNNLPIILRAN